MYCTKHVLFTFLLIPLQHMNCNELNELISVKISYFMSQVGFCSDYFQYVRYDDFIIGKLTISNISIGDNIKMQFYRTDLYLQKTFNGSLLPDENSQTVIDKLQKKQNVTFRVDFPMLSEVPKLEKIFVNDTELCTTKFVSSGEKIFIQNTLEIINGTIPVFTFNTHIPKFLEISSCGLVDTELVDGHNGGHPWLAAIYKKKSTGIIFTCSGTIVTSKFILTAAHCVYEMTPIQILAYLGRNDLNNYEDDETIVSEVEAILLNPEYRPVKGFSDTDLALLKLQDSVSFSQFIKAVCLWREPTDEALILNQTGVVVVWGSGDDDEIISLVPQKVKINIVSKSDCLRSIPNSTSISSSRALCAGKRDGFAPCEADSGSGVILNRKGLWMLRGVISIGLSTADKCNLREYSLYSDVAKQKQWLENYIQQEPAVTSSFEAICGEAGMDPRNAYPWLAAVYRKLQMGMVFHCTGALISSRSILAPAHCIDLVDRTLIGADFLKVYLGRYDLKDMMEKTVVSRDVATVVPHPGYQSKSSLFDDNDIIILQLKAPVDFTQYIKPICLWSEPDEALTIEGQSATLLSYDRFGLKWENVTTPQSIVVKIASIQKCQEAGYNVSRSASVLCTPHFGNVNAGGFLLLKRYRRWLIRGLSSRNEYYDENYPIRPFRLYADITKYLSWIKSKTLS